MFYGSYRALISSSYSEVRTALTFGSRKRLFKSLATILEYMKLNRRWICFLFCLYKKKNASGFFACFTLWLFAVDNKWVSFWQTADYVEIHLMLRCILPSIASHRSILLIYNREKKTISESPITSVSHISHWYRTFTVILNLKDMSWHSKESWILLKCGLDLCVSVSLIDRHILSVKGTVTSLR